MSIQPLLLDVVKFMALGKIETIKVSPEASGTAVFRTYDPDRDLIIVGKSLVPQDFPSDFGLFNFKILKGLLNMSNFQTDGSQVKVTSRALPDGTEIAEKIDFKGGGTKAVYRLMSREVVPDQPEITNIPWDTTLSLSASKIAEFQQMASLYMEVDPVFKLRSESGDLIADFGNNSASTHSGSMVLQEAIATDVMGELEFKIDKFLLMLKTAAGAKTMEVRLCGRGLLGVMAVSEHCHYDYLLKKSM